MILLVSLNSIFEIYKIIFNERRYCFSFLLLKICVIIKGEITMNVFDSPKRYKDSILESVMVSESKTKKFNGKSFTCVFFTKFCNAGCPFCFF